MPYDLPTRASVVALKAYGGKTTNEVSAVSNIPPRSCDDIYSRAIKRGFDPNLRPAFIREKYLADSPRSGRPKKQTEEIKEIVISKISRDRDGGEKSVADIAGELCLEGRDISSATVWRIIKETGYKKTKPTRKPGLSKKKQDRLNWYLEHGH